MEHLNLYLLVIPKSSSTVDHPGRLGGRQTLGPRDLQDWESLQTVEGN